MSYVCEATIRASRHVVPYGNSYGCLAEHHADPEPDNAEHHSRCAIPSGRKRPRKSARRGGDDEDDEDDEDNE